MATIQGVNPVTNEGLQFPLHEGAQGPQGIPGPQGPEGPAPSDASTSSKGIVRLAGDITGTASSPQLIAVGTAGTYPKVTTDSKGRVTSGASLDSSDVTLGLGYTPLNRGGDSMTGKLAPGVVSLTDAATIATNAALGTVFRVTLGGNRTMGVPTNPTDGQLIEYQFKQDATGGRTVTWSSGSGGFSFGTTTEPALSNNANKLDRVSFRYNATLDRWLFSGALTGF